MTITLDLVLHVYSFLCTVDGAAVDGRWAATRTPIAASIREGRRERGAGGGDGAAAEGIAEKRDGMT